MRAGVAEWSKALGSGPNLVGVREFESRPPQSGGMVNLFRDVLPVVILRNI